MSVRTFMTLGAGVAAVVAVAQGCSFTEPNPRHCNNNEGDEYCNRELGDGITVLYCERGTPECRTPDSQYGCVEQRPADECYSPCGGQSTIDENGECVVMEDSSSGSSSGETETDESTGSSSESSSSTTGPMPCVNDEECTEPEAPFCGTTGECGTCDQTEDGDAACAGVDPLLPLCVGDACVACTDGNPIVCEDQLLLCDGTTNTCVPCTEHGQCGSGACELDVGRCFPGDFVVHVDGDGGQDYISVTAAVADVRGTHGVIVVHEQDSGLGYPGVTIDAGKTIALLAAAGEAPRIQGTAGNPGVAVQGAGTILYMDGLSLRSGDALGLRVTEAFAWVDRSHIVDNNGGGIVAETGAELVLRNCFVGQALDVVSLDVAESSATVLYSTVATSTFGATPALRCSSPLTVDIRNSIIVSQGGTPPDELACPSATVTYSATEGVVAGAGNESVGPFPMMPASWFVDHAAGNYALQNEGLTIFADIAQWSTGDPPIDIDGDLRPTDDATPDYAGADVP